MLFEYVNCRFSRCIINDDDDDDDSIVGEVYKCVITFTEIFLFALSTNIEQEKLW